MFTTGERFLLSLPAPALGVVRLPSTLPHRLRNKVLTRRAFLLAYDGRGVQELEWILKWLGTYGKPGAKNAQKIF